MRTSGAIRLVGSRNTGQRWSDESTLGSAHGLANEHVVGSDRPYQDILASLVPGFLRGPVLTGCSLWTNNRSTMSLGRHDVLETSAKNRWMA